LYDLDVLRVKPPFIACGIGTCQQCTYHGRVLLPAAGGHPLQERAVWLLIAFI